MADDHDAAQRFVNNQTHTGVESGGEHQTAVGEFFEINSRVATVGHGENGRQRVEQRMSGQEDFLPEDAETLFGE